MNIIKKTSTHNTGAMRGRKIQWIVLHYTAGVTSAPGSALNTAAYFATTDRQASADFCVDDRDIVQYNGDIENRYCWAVGGKKYTYMTTKQGGIHYGVCKNNNSISIEMCSNKTNRKSLSATDTDWFLTEKTIANAVSLTVWLMRKYGVPLSNVIMHHHVNGKPCPQPWCRDERALSGWNAFKSAVTAELKKGDEDDMTEAQVGKLISAALEQERVELMKTVTQKISEAKGPVYNTIDEVPEWGRGTVRKLVNSGKLRGTDKGLALSYDLLRVLVVMDR